MLQIRSIQMYLIRWALSGLFIPEGNYSFWCKHTNRLIFWVFSSLKKKMKLLKWYHFPVFHIPYWYRSLIQLTLLKKIYWFWLNVKYERIRMITFIPNKVSHQHYSKNVFFPPIQTNLNVYIFCNSGNLTIMGLKETLEDSILA